ncbi:MAG: hypothetical protein QNI90_17190 [Dinoroseobacter sp.]|nr:hypothetical protein [Dinoroseobacter sp.]
MSSSNLKRRTVIGALSLAAPLAACGFSPVYAPDSSANSLRGTIQYRAPSNPDQFDIARHVEQRLGVATNPKFELVILPTVVEESLAVAAAEDITRFDLVGVADFALSDLQSGEVLLNGQVNTFTSYSVTGSTVTALASARDAQSRLMVALTDLTLTRIIAAADTLPL